MSFGSATVCAFMWHFTRCLFVSLSIFDRVMLMTESVCQWKPLWIPRGDTFQKACLEEWERADDEQSHVPGEDKPHRISRTTESEKSQTAKEDEWNTTREPPPSLPKSSWQTFGQSNAPSWKHRDSGKRSILGAIGRTTAPRRTASATSFIRRSSQTSNFAVP